MLGKYVKNVYKKYFQPTTDPSPPDSSLATEQLHQECSQSTIQHNLGR